MAATSLFMDDLRLWRACPHSWLDADGDDGDPMCGSGVRPADDRALQRGVGHQRQGARAGLTERAEREGG
eukprot:3545983-Rhodomonas_salina.3